MGQGDSAGDFDPSESIKNAGILDVFPIFRTARLGQKIHRSPQSPLCGVALTKHAPVRPVMVTTGLFLRFPNEFLMAPGAGDGDFALPSRHPHHLTAFGTVKIAVVPILQPTDDLQKFPVFLIPLVGVSGQGAKNRPDHQTVAQQHQQQIDRRIPKNHRQQADRQTDTQDDHIQLVRAIASRHKAAEPCGEPRGNLMKPAANAIHKYHPVQKIAFV